MNFHGSVLPKESSEKPWVVRHLIVGQKQNCWKTKTCMFSHYIYTGLK